MTYTTLIADDEALARERLRSLLEDDERFEVVAEAADGRSALQAIREHAPQLVFLDIQMPEMTGVETLAQLHAELPPERRPAVIFVTAYDEFALRAFDLHAVDYLLKPFDRLRFEAALDKALAQLRQPDSGELNQRLAALIAEFSSSRRSSPKYLERLPIKTEGRVLLVPVEEIDWIGAANNYVEIHVGKASHLMRETLSVLESKLDPEKFLRISRSTIVAIDRIREIQPLFHGEQAVILRNGTKLTASRSYKDALKSLLNR